MTDDMTPATADQLPVADAQAEQPAEPQVEQTAEAPSEPAPKRSASAREALEKAFRDQPEDAAVKAPQEEDGQASGPQRGPDGKFVAKEGAEPKDGQPDAQAEAAPKDDKPPVAKDAPARFSADAKASWEKTPEPVRAEVQRAMREMEQGIQQYKERVEPLDRYFQMADKHGVKLEAALERYVNMETMLAQDPVRGFTEVARNMGLSPQQVAQMLMGQQPGKGDARDTEINQLRQQVQQLQQGYGQVQQSFQQQREQAVMSEIDKFAAEHPRFEELADEMARMLSTGYAEDMPDAYEKADRLRPAPAPQQETAAPSPPAQTRPAKSLTGAPSPGSNPATRRAPSKSPREALARAFGA